MDGLSLLRHYIRFKAVPIALALIGFALGTAYARLAPRYYDVGMTIGPPQPDDRPSVSEGISASLFGQLTGVTRASPSYIAFIQKLTSADVAAQVAAESPDTMHIIFKSWWNPSTRQWRRREQGIGAMARSLLGLPTAHAPTPYDLAAYLQRNVHVRAIGKTDLYRIDLLVEDPQFGVKLLNELVSAADGLTKDANRSRLVAYLAQIDTALPSVHIAEIRAALAQVYAQTEEERMLILDHRLYAISMIDSPRASSAPVRPSLLQIGAFTAAGFVLGLVIVLVHFIATVMLREPSFLPAPAE